MKITQHFNQDGVINNHVGWRIGERFIYKGYAVEKFYRNSYYFISLYPASAFATPKAVMTAIDNFLVRTGKFYEFKKAS